MRNLKVIGFGLGLLAAASFAAAQDTHATGNQSGDHGGNRALPQSVLYDNGPTDGSNGYSNATAAVFGARRTLLDDFVVSDRAGWRITDFHWEHIWTSGGRLLGTGMELSFRADAGGAPGAVVATANITNYMEQANGNTWFGRPGMDSWVDFDPIVLGPGTYWFEATIVGPENNFWMVRTSVTGSECWVNYDDFGGLQPGTAIFGVAKDLNFIITGEIVPTPGSLALLGLGGLACGTRRRRR